MARLREPGAAAIAFMKTLAPTEARFSARGRRAAAVQRQRDAQAGEDQGGGVGDRGFQGGDGGQVAGGVDHPPKAVKLTAAAAAARTHRPPAALRSHRP